MASHIAGIYYSFYDDLQTLENELEDRREAIQLIVARPGLLRTKTYDFGEAQRPSLTDYADGVDTLEFLTRLPALTGATDAGK